MAEQTTTSDFRDDEQNAIVGEDSRSLELTHRVLAERLVCLEVAEILKDSQNGDFMVITEILENGFRGYHKMSSGELWSEWKEVEERFYGLYEAGALPYAVCDEDPLLALEQDETGEVAQG